MPRATTLSYSELWSLWRSSNSPSLVLPIVLSNKLLAKEIGL